MFTGLPVRVSACPVGCPCRQSLVLEVAVGKFLDTSLIRADVQPRAARLLIKGRLLQLVLPAEVGGCPAAPGCGVATLQGPTSRTTSSPGVHACFTS